RAVLGDQLVVDGKTESEIRRQVVDASLGEKAKGWSDDAVTAGFDALTAKVQPVATGGTGNLSDAITAFARPNVQDRNALYDAHDNALQNAWKGPQTTRQ